MLGLGAMLHILGGGSPKSASDYCGRTITAATFSEEELRLTFSDGVTIRIWDNGQSCCEHRYMTCDDDVQDLVGRQLREIVVKEGPEGDSEYGEHQIAFLEIATDRNSVTVCTHNEHNGYYGGFGLSLDEVANKGD